MTLYRFFKIHSFIRAVPSKNALCPLFIVSEMKTDYRSIKYDTSYALFNFIIFCRLKAVSEWQNALCP